MKVFALVSTLVLVQACGQAQNTSGVASTHTSASSNDAALVQEVKSAIAGLSTGGGEGDPSPYQVVELDAAAGQALTNQYLLANLLPKLKGFEGSDARELIPGMDLSNLQSTWKDMTSAPKREDFASDGEYSNAIREATQWGHVKALFDSKLTDVMAFDMGYRSSAGGSLETGPVAHVLLGRTPAGDIIAIYGIDIWT